MESTTKITLKILIDRKLEQVLFAEAGKDFVDFLFEIVLLPLGAVLTLLSKENMIGCLANLHESIENLSETYMQPSANKNNVLNPKTPTPYSSNAPLLLPSSAPASPTTAKTVLYRCPNSYGECTSYVSDDPQAICSRCRIRLTKQVTYVPAAVKAASGETGEGGGGYVKGVVTYMIMDNLEVKPMSTISCISLLSKLKINDLSALEEKVVDFSTEEALKLLKASLQSKTTLSDVFLEKKLSIEGY